MDVSILRKAASKSMGDDFFAKYEIQFVEGCMTHSNMDEKSANAIWKDIQHAGSWLFNKSLSVAYGMLSYYTAYMKAHHPLAFFAASLNHAKSEDSALRILRDAVTNDKIEYIPIDADESLEGWTVSNGRLIGGLTNIKGIADKKAKAIIKARSGKGKWTPSMLKTLSDPKTPFDMLFPARELWEDLIENPYRFGIENELLRIDKIEKVGHVALIGRMIDRNVNDLNEYNKVVKRGHKLEGCSIYLNIILEDDHDSIMCSIGRFDYERLNGRVIAEQAKVGSDWFVVEGSIGESWRGISVDKITNLTEWRKAYEARDKAC